MSSPAVIPAEPVKKEFGWRRLFIKAAGFGAGFALMFVICAVAINWYSSRPKPPKPWNQKAITAEFDTPAAEGDDNSVVFYYTLINNTDSDYQLDSNGSSFKLGARLEKQNSVSMDDEKGFIAIDNTVFVPARGRSRFAVHSKYPYPVREKSEATQEEKRDFRTILAQFIVKEMGNLDGFVIFDEKTRYEILLPSGWKETAKRQLEASKK